MSPKCQFKAFQEKRSTRLRAREAGQEGGPDQPKLSEEPKRPSEPQTHHHHVRRAQAPCPLCVLLLLFLEGSPGASLFNHPALGFFTKSLGLNTYLRSAQISTMSSRADRWSSEATSPSLFALRSRCRCFSLSDSVGLSSSTKSLLPS